MAIKSQQSFLSVSTAAASTKAITAITAAAPPVVTSASHGYANGDIVNIAAIVGMVQLNNRSFVVANQTANTFELKGVDGTAYTAYASGGTASKQTMLEMGAVKSIGQGFDGTASELDVTNLRSTAKEFLLGLQDFGNVAIGVFLVTDTGQTKLRALKASAAIGSFTITLSDGTVSAFQALVKSFSFDALAPDSVAAGSLALRVTGEPAWFA